MNNKEKYIEFCNSEIDIPIFSKNWWLDAVCQNESWDVVLVEKNNKIISSMPYLISKRRMFLILGMPRLTQKLGPYIKYPLEQKLSSRLDFEKKVMKELISKLPRFDMFLQNFNYNLTNWLPFYWSGFQQTTRYTYVLDDLKDLDIVVENFSKKNRQLFVRGVDNIRIVDDLGVDEFYRVCNLTFKRQNMKIPYSLDLVKSIFKVCKDRNSGKPFFAVDDENRIHSVSFVVWDSISMYSIIGGGDPLLRNSGAKQMIFFEAIKLAKEKEIKFDFEGSMIENIEHFYRAFGAKQMQYFSVSKTDSKIIKLVRLFKEAIR